MLDYCLIGETLKHSFSPMLHHEFNNKEYGLMEIPKNEIDDFMKKAEFKAINVTIPYKETVMPYCELDETATVIGAVNTIVNKDGKLYGYNTDHLGFTHMVKRAGIDVEGKDVVILGSGGTSKTSCYAISKMKAASITIVSRSASDYETHVDCPVKFTSYDDEAIYKAQVIVNTTPVGMFPNIDATPVEISRFKNLTGVIDVVYNPLNTRLVLEAKEHGIKATNGLSMLVAQAYYAEKLFFDEPTTIDEKALDSIEKALFKLTDMKRNIVLTGMPGSGKSTIGKALSDILNKPFIDTDEMFLDKHKIQPGDYITEYGEEAFRVLESECVKEASMLSGYIIATGGGVILNKKNTDLLSLNGDIVYLHRPLKELVTHGRPLSQGDERRKALYYKRLPLYMSSKKYLVDVKGSVESVTDAVLSAINNQDSNMKKYLIINGPNLNMLGIREPGIYGTNTYGDLMNMIEAEAKKLNVLVEFYQSNHEGDLVDAIQNTYGRMNGIVINPGAYTHTSVAILDAVKAVGVPTVEVHISDVDAREEFRQISYIKKAAIDTIAGYGFDGYVMALKKLIDLEDK